MNKNFLIGRLGANPEVRTLASGQMVANLSVATEESYKGKDGKWVNETTWHRVTVWGEARCNYIAKHYAKGDLIQVEGKLTYQDYESTDGKKYRNAVIVGQTTLLADAPSKADQAAEPKNSAAKGKKSREAERQTADLDDEIPF